MSKQIPTFDQIREQNRSLQQMAYEHWIHKELFTYCWWIQLALWLIPLVIWLIVARRNIIIELLFGGSFMCVVTLLLDLNGANLSLWSYPNRLLYSFYPPMIPVDVSLMPITYMLLYQYFKSWRIFLYAAAAVSAIYSFLAEPLFNWLDMYQLDNWKYAYSFPIYIAIMLLTRFLVLYAKRLANKNPSNQH